MREDIEKMMESTELDGLSESVTEKSAEESPIMRGRPVRRARMSSEANGNGLELLSENSLKAALQKYFHETMRTPSSVMAYLANPCVRTVLQVRLLWGLAGIRRREHEATIETRSREKQLELMGALRVLIARDDSAIALCSVKFVVDRIPHSGARRMCKDKQT